MAYEIQPASEGNVDTPLTNFPVSKDSFGRMQDVTISLLPLVLQYNQFYSNGDFVSASRLVNDNPDLDDCLHNAKKWNQLRDAVIAMEDFLLNQVDELYNSVSQNAIGINDEPTDEQAKIVAYSAEKVLSLFNTKYTTLPLTGWSNEAPYTQTIIVDDMKETYSPIITCNLDEVESAIDKKYIQKSWNYVDTIEIGDGEITATCKFKKPIIDIPLVIKGV